MLTVATFRVLLPEFDTGIADARVQLALDAAAVSVDETIFHGYTDTAHGMLAAHILTRGPKGREAAAQKTDFRSSSYLEEFNRLAELVGGGLGST